MKKIFTSLFLLFVFAFFLNTVVAQNSATSFGPAPSGTEAKSKDNTSSAANPLSRAFCYNGNVNFQLNKQSLSNTTLTPVGSTVPFGFPGAAAWNYSNNRMYVIDQASPFALYTVDTLTGVRTFIANCTGVPHANFTGLTWDMVTGNMYGISSSITASQIFTVNITTGVCTPIGSPTTVVAGGIMVNAARNGTLFSVDIVADNLYKWNKTTGVPTLVGPIGFNANFGQDAHFDFSDGQYYWAAFNSTAGQAQLRLIDTLTGGSTLIGAYAGQVSTLGIYVPLAPSVTINQAAGQPDPTSSQPINFTAVFDQNVTGFTTGDVTVSGTASAGATATVTGSGSTYNVSVSGMTVGGTIIVNIPAGVCTNSNGDLNVASTSTDNQVTYALPSGCTSVNNVPNQTVCTGSPTAPVNFASPTPGTTFSWTNNNTAIGLGASGSGNIPSFIATNPGVTPITGTITVTPFVFTSGGPCTPSAAQTFTNSTPVPISTGAPAVISSTIVVSGAPTYLYDLNMLTNITHTFNGDLDITITSPAGTVVTLTSDNGSASDNVFNGTTWDDDANPLGQVPYTNNNGLVTDHLYVNNTTATPLVPEEAFGAFIGENPNGTWTIRVSDDATGDGGSLDSWALIISGLASPPTVTSSSFTNNTPVTIPTTVSVVTSTINVTGVGTQLLDANVLTSINHTWSDDMDITITSPAGTVVTLTTDNGGSNDNTYAGTTWDDDANPLGQVPYTNNNGMATDHLYVNNTTATPLVPEEALAAFIGENPNGVWTLTISDDAGGDGGVLNSWGLNLQTSACGTVCAGPPTTFTITVSPNPAIVIVADPGTTICEGDPTLLTVRIGSSSPVGTLYDQTGVAANGAPSQVFEPANTAFNSQAADDFTVPAGTSWTVTRITTLGIGTGNPTSVNVFFYANSGSNLPGAPIASFNNIAFTRTGGNYDVTLPSSVVLAPGTYWMSFQVNMSFATSGQWFWGNYGATNIGFERAWQNPGGGFGTPCTSWGYGGTGCNVGGGAANRNHRFTIVGSSITDGGPLPPGYTFLWSPAAGLSSTTSNPVAASPMNTTTYTVTVTTPGNCTRTASILINVNKRPVVTTQPAAAVRCVGNTATFTVGGTGTGLTYQWQESINGCTGPWVDLTNGGAYSGVNTATLTITNVTGLMNGRGYRAVLGGACAPWNPPTNVSNCALLTVNPNPNVSITPAVSCGGVAGISGTQLSVGSAPPPVPGSVTVNSGAISIPVPDNTPNGVSSNLTVAGIPANATITGVRATWTMPHTWNGDMVFVLRSPNGSILNLDYYLSATGGAGATTGFVNTTVSSAGVNALSTGTGTYTGTFAADARTVAQAPFGPPGPTGFAPTVSTWTPMYTPIPNGTWTLAMYDGGPADLGTLTNWSITVDYTTPGGGGGPTLTYVWSPLTGLYNNSTATNPYLGTNTPIVYAAPTQLTVYTVRATDVATGCFTDATAIVNYTPPAPTVTPSSVAMCLGDPAVKLKSSSSTPGSSTFSSGTVNIPIPDGPTIPPVPTSYPATTSNITVSGIPAGATITAVRARFNVTHAWVSDLVMALRAPNGSIVNLDAMVNRTNQPGANFTNTVISSAATNPLGGAAPYTGTFADDAAGATFIAFGFTFPGGPVGYVPTTQQYTDLFTSGAVNGVWSVGIYDAGAPDAGTLNNWSLDIDYVVGVPATAATWSPLAGLFNDAAATIPYAGTPVDSVWARPTPAGVYPYQATVQSLPVLSSFANPANIVINASGPGTPYPANLTVSGLPPTGVSVDSVRLTGISHTWGDDIDILLQSPTGQNVVLMSDVGGIVAVPNATYTFRDGAPAMNPTAANPTGTYRPTNNGAADTWPAPGPGAITQATPTLASFGNTANVNGAWKLFVFDDVGGDAGNISGGFRIWFNVSVPACTSPARTVVVTVNSPTTVTTQPVNQTICTDKVATFTVVPGGSGPFTYQWQVSTNGGNPPWTNITNGGVYSGATTATLTITAPPVSMSGYQYRVIINGAVPCGPATSFARILTVNPLPVVTITADRTRIFPGMTATLTSTVTPNAPAPNGGYTWLRNGVAVPGGNTGTLVVDIDNLGDYTLRVTDINGCTNISNMISIKDSVSGKCFIYPNPTSGMFQVRYYSVANNVLPRTLTIYDAKGDRVFTKMYTIGRPYDRMDVDMRAYSKGLYWVEIGDLNGSRLTMCRVVIQ